MNDLRVSSTKELEGKLKRLETKVSTLVNNPTPNNAYQVEIASRDVSGDFLSVYLDNVRGITLRRVERFCTFSKSAQEVLRKMKGFGQEWQKSITGYVENIGYRVKEVSCFKERDCERGMKKFHSILDENMLSFAQTKS